MAATDGSDMQQGGGDAMAADLADVLSGLGLASVQQQQAAADKPTDGGDGWAIEAPEVEPEAAIASSQAEQPTEPAAEPRPAAPAEAGDEPQQADPPGEQASRDTLTHQQAGSYDDDAPGDASPSPSPRSSHTDARSRSSEPDPTAEPGQQAQAHSASSRGVSRPGPDPATEATNRPDDHRGGGADPGGQDAAGPARISSAEDHGPDFLPRRVDEDAPQNLFEEMFFSDVSRGIDVRYVELAESYAATKSVTEAARLSHYSVSTASVLLRKPEVWGMVLRRLGAMSRSMGVKSSMVVKEYSNIAFSRVTNYIDGGSGKWLDLEGFKRLDDSAKAAVSEVTFYKDGRIRRLKLHDKMRALRSLGEHMGIFQGDGGDNAYGVGDGVSVVDGDGGGGGSKSLHMHFHGGELERKSKERLLELLSGRVGGGSSEVVEVSSSGSDVPDG